MRGSYEAMILTKTKSSSGEPSSSRCGKCGAVGEKYSLSIDSVESFTYLACGGSCFELGKCTNFWKTSSEIEGEENMLALY